MSAEYDSLAAELHQLVETAKVTDMNGPDMLGIAYRVGEIVTTQPELSMRAKEEQ